MPAHRSADSPRPRWDAPTVAAVVAVGAVHIRGLHPGTGVTGDMSELQLVALVQGVAHPSGYPVWTWLAGAVEAFVPLGDPLWRINLCAALASVAALVGLARALGILRVRGLARGGVVAMAGLTLTWWQHATMAEVYTLHLAAVAWALAAGLDWRARGQPLALVAGALVGGLGMANHVTMAAVLPVLLWIGAARRPRPGLALAAAAVFVLAVALPYAWLVHRSQDPALAWRYRELADLSALLAHLTGAEYHGLVQPGVALAQPEQVVGRGAWQVLRELGPLLPLALLGGRRAPWGLAAGLAVPSAAFAVAYAVPEPQVYLLPAVLAAALLAGAGAARLAAWTRWGRVLGPLWAAAGVAVLVGFNAPLADRSSAPPEPPWVAPLLAHIPPGDVLITGTWERSTPLWLYTLGLGQPGPRIRHHVEGAAQAAAVAAYVGGQAPLALSHQQLEVPPGPGVWCMAPERLPLLQDAGLTVERVAPGLWRVF